MQIVAEAFMFSNGVLSFFEHSLSAHVVVCPCLRTVFAERRTKIEFIALSYRLFSRSVRTYFRCTP